ncbi:Uncharacterised protein [Neisseria meningitidis]|nr:Uncharacterised protein [Neisseria meningitidis]
MQSCKNLSEMTETVNVAALAKKTETERTRFPPARLDSHLRGNDESIHTETYIPSFLRTYIPSFPQRQKTKIRNLKFVIPAQAGIRALSFSYLE